MTALTDLISAGGGGGGTSYLPSTAVVHAPVTAGSSFVLSSTGAIYPDPSLPSANPTRNVYGEGLNTSVTNPNNVTVYLANQYGDTILPNGITIFSLYSNTTSHYSQMVTSLDNGATVADAAATNPTWIHEYNTNFRYYLLDEDATYYYMGYQHQSSDVNSTKRVVGGTAVITKATGAITLDKSQEVSSSSSYGTSLSEDTKNNLRLARGGTVWVQTYIKNSTESTGVHVNTGTTSSASNYALGTRVTQSDLNSQWNKSMFLGKINDANGTFLTINKKSAYPYLQIKVLTIAADGSHSFSSPISESTNGSNGLSSTLNDSNYTRYFETSPGNFHAVRFNTYTNLVHQAFSYTSGSTFTSTSEQTMTMPSLADGTVIHPYYWWNTSSYSTYHYDPTNNYLYSSQGAVANSYAGYYDYAIKFDLTNNTSTLISGVKSITNHTNQRRIYVDPTTNDYYFLNTNNTAFDSVRDYKFDSSLIYTSGANAIVLADATAGSTVNIVLKEGITSEATLPSSQYLFKQDQYFPLDVAGVSPPAFTYFSPQQNLVAEVSYGVTNAAAVGDEILTIKAPAGKYLSLYKVHTNSSTTSSACAGVKIDGNIVSTRVGGASGTPSQTSYTKSHAHSPVICKEFSFYREGTGTESSASQDLQVFYFIGAPV